VRRNRLRYREPLLGDHLIHGTGGGILHDQARSVRARSAPRAHGLRIVLSDRRRRRRAGENMRGSARACHVHADTKHCQQAGKKHDKCVAVHDVAAGQNRSHDRRPEKRATEETARMPPSIASRFPYTRLCHGCCQIHRDVGSACLMRLQYAWHGLEAANAKRGRKTDRVALPLQAASAKVGADSAAITRTTSSACALADVTAARSASSPSATPSMRTTLISVMPIKPSTVRR
jgi:hypothetical protein